MSLRTRNRYQETWRRLRSLFAFRTPSNDTPVVLLRFFLRRGQKIHPLLPKGPGVKIFEFFSQELLDSSSFFDDKKIDTFSLNIFFQFVSFPLLLTAEHL